MRRMGVEVVVPAGLPNSRIPHSWGLDGFELFTSPVVLLPDQRFFEIRVLDAKSALVTVLRQRDDVLFADKAPLVPADRPVAHAELLDGHDLVDRLDLLDTASEDAHRFRTIEAPGVFTGNPRPEKVLGYLEPVQPLTVHTQGRHAAFHPVRWHASHHGEEPTPIVRDGGRAITHEAHWLIDGVRADRDLTVLIRSDRAGFGRYHLFINGHKTPQRLQLLQVRDRGLDGACALYHAWFLQPSTHIPRDGS